MHRMIYWNYERKLMRERMREYAEKQQAKRKEKTMVVEILEGEDKGKLTTIYLDENSQPINNQ